MQAIGEHFDLIKGDIIEAHFKILSLFESYQIQTLIDKVNEDPRFQVLDHRVVKGTFITDTLELRIRILENPFPLALLVLAVGGIGTAMFVYLSFDKAFLISREIGPVATTTLGMGVLAIAALALFIFLKK